MKTKFIRLAIGSLLVLASPALLAQNNFATNISATTTVTTTSTVTNVQPRKYRRVVEGEESLLPPGLKEELKLTEEQSAELKPIEDDFANTSRQYQIANQPRIDAAQEANRQARESKNTTQIQAARKQLQDVWAGLQPYRETAVNRIKPLLTPDQLTVLEDAKNQWRENHVHEENDPSAN